MAEVVSQNDISKIVNAIVENTNQANTVITAVIGSIKKIAESKSVDVKINDVLFVEKMVVSYKNVIKSIIDALCTDDNGQARDLHVLLGAMKDRNKSTSDKIVMKYKTIDAALQIPKVIDGMFDIVGKLGESNVGFKTLVKFKINILRLKSMIKTVFNDLITALSEIDTTKEMDKITKCLVKQPDIITSVSEQSVDANSNKTSIEETTTKHGKLGILDVFAKTFEIIGVLNTLKAPNFMLLKLRLLEMKIALKTTLNDLMQWCEKNINDNTRIRLMYVEDALLGAQTDGGKGKRVGGIQSIITSLGNIISTADKINFKSVVSLILFRGALWILNGVINGIKKIYLLLKPLESRWKTLDKNISNLQTVIENITNIFKSITIMAILSAPVVAGIVVGSIAILAICGFIWVIKLLELTVIKAKIDSQTITPLSNIFTSLKQIMIDVLLVGLVAIPAVIAMIPITLFVGALLLTTLAICAISKLIDGIAKNVNDNLKTLSATFGLLMLIGVSILVIALATPIIIKALTENIASLLIVLLISVITLGIVTWIASVISRKAVGYSIELSINILIIMSALMIAAMVILIAAQAGDKLKDSDAIGTIVLTILGMIVLAGIMIGLGFALAAALPGIALAIGGISPMVVLLGMMVAAGLAMVALSKVDLDFGEYDKKTNTGTGIKGNIGKILEFADWVYEAIGDKKRSEIIQARRGKRYMRQINKTVKLIKNIAHSIESISKITIDREKLLGDNGTIPLLFKTVEEINTKLFGDGGLMANDTSANYEALDFIMPWRLVSKSVNQKENKANRKLNRINKVISTLNNIGGSLMSIQKLKLDKDVRESIESKIGQMFTFISYLSGKISDFMKPSEDATVNVSNKDIKKANKKLSKVEAVMLSLKSITDSLKGIGEIKIGSITDKKSLAGKANDNIANVFGATNSLMNTVKAKIEDLEDVDDLEDFAEEMTPVIACIKDLTSQFSGFANINSTQLDKNINSFSGFIDKVNTIDVEKAQKTTQLFKQMSRFSESIKGDFDKLAEALTEKMLPVLEELKDIMDKVPEKLDTGFANTSASISAVNAPATFENVAAQLNRENPDKDKGFIEKLLDKRMAEKAQQEANSTAAKLDELITLLKGFGPQPAVIKTL